MGIFDSGIGGLTVLAACVRSLPAARFYYLGDNAHAPYGSRTGEEITRFVRTALQRFARLRADAAVLACNTATAVCAERMRAEFSFPVIGMEPAVAPAAKTCRRILVLATPRTVQSDRLHALLARFPSCSFSVVPLPALAGAVERHFRFGENLTLSDYLPRIPCDGVVLGCTHYAFFRREIGDFYRVPVFDGADGTARQLYSVLAEREKCLRFGTADHLLGEQNPNKCFTKKYKKGQNGGIFFLGKAKKDNQRVYFTNICFNFN